MPLWDSVPGSRTGLSGVLAQLAGGAVIPERVASRPASVARVRGAHRAAAGPMPLVEVVPSAPAPHEFASRPARSPHVAILSEDLFRSALIRERRRADRFDDAFGVVTISIKSEVAGQLAAVLDTAIGDTDVVGWVEEGAVLGIIRPEVAGSADADADAREINARLQRELEGTLGPAMAGMEMRCHVHAGPGAGGVAGLHADTPLLDVIQDSEQRRIALDRRKRALDIVGSLALLVLLAPVCLLVAALVKLTSSGPVLFKQVRVGQRAKPFTMLKFRTMQVNNDTGVHQQFVADFIKSSSSLKLKKENCETFFKIKNDPRVTPIGRILRKSSLDELPQLWNVLRGDMSLVGPRPPLHYELEQYRSWHWRRVLEAKPGLTGLWQVTGRSRTTFDEMVRLDLRYARGYSLWMDIKILLATPRAVITGKGAS